MLTKFVRLLIFFGVQQGGGTKVVWGHHLQEVQMAPGTHPPTLSRLGGGPQGPPGGEPGGRGGAARGGGRWEDFLSLLITIKVL